MNRVRFFSVAIGLAGLMAASQVQATTYPGNGASGFGGPVGQGSLAVTDDGVNITFTLTRGPNNLNDALVIYLDSVAGGYADTSTLTDIGDGARKAISGYDGSNRSTMTFASGFAPDYAVAIEGGFASIFDIVNSANNFTWETGTGQGGSSAASFSLTFSLAQMGLTAGQSFKLFGTLISGTAYRSDEAIAGNDSGTQGVNPFTQTSYGTYTTVPEPTTFALVGIGLLGALVLRRRKA